VQYEHHVIQQMRSWIKNVFTLYHIVLRLKFKSVSFLFFLSFFIIKNVSKLFNQNSRNQFGDIMHLFCYFASYDY